MKKHLSGFLIFLLAFAIGFLSAPIRFNDFASGSTSRGWFRSYHSTYFINVALSGEPCETEEEAKAAFESRIERYSEYVLHQKVLELKGDRAVIFLDAEYFGQAFCVIRKENFKVYDICSASLGHVLEFEKQNFYKK